MNILVLHPGALGDIILSLPALDLLRRRYTQGGITLAGNLDYLNAVYSGHADRVLSLSTVPLHRLYVSDPLPESDIAFWTSFDRIVSWTGSGDPLFCGRLAAIVPDSKVSGWKPGVLESRHVARVFVESLYPWIPPAESIPPARIRPSPSIRAEARQWLVERGWTPGEKIVALHPGAASPGKRWPVDCFRQVALAFSQEGRGKTLIIEGPAEPGLGSAVTVQSRASGFIAAVCPSLTLLAAVLSLCSGYVGNDSGVSHLAAGVGLPSVVLFGPTSPGLWRPLGDRVAVLNDPCLERITAEGVLQALASLGCS